MRNRATADGTANSEILVQNVSGAAVTVQIQMIAAPGSGFTGYTKTGITINPGASYAYNLVSESPANVSDNWYGSAVVSITSGGSTLVVVSNLRTGANIVQTFNGFPSQSQGTSWGVPLFMSRLANGLSTPVAVQNLMHV